MLFLNSGGKSKKRKADVVPAMMPSLLLSWSGVELETESCRERRCSREAEAKAGFGRELARARTSMEVKALN